MSDLSHLFPNLAAQLSDWDGRQVTDDGSNDPSHGGVTDADIEAYLTRMGSLRAPLQPIVSGQQAPIQPEFFNNGRAVPPGGSATVEPPQPAVTPAAPPSGDEGTAAGAEGEEEPGAVTPPPPPPPPTEPPPYYEIAGRRYDRAQAEAWATFDQMVAADPQLKQTIANYLQQRSGITPPPAPTPIATDLPTLPPEYADDETISSLYRRVQSQQDALDRLSRQASNAEQLAQHQIQRTYTDIAQGAISEFKNTYQLDDSLMASVSQAARMSGFAEKYMSGVDPLTGSPVTPDPYKATMAALQAGYYMSPDTRQLEVQREADRRAAQALADATRKEKLGGVSGAAGSVPRTQNVPTNPQDARQAMRSEVEQMLQGQWVGDGSS